MNWLTPQVLAVFVAMAQALAILLGAVLLGAAMTVVERRLQQLRRGLAGAAEVRPTSARWAWVEAQLAQGGPAWGEAVIEAVAAGGNFSAYKRAFKNLDPATRGPWRLAASAS